MTPSTPASRICSRRGASCSTARSSPSRDTVSSGSITYTGTPPARRSSRDRSPAVGGESSDALSSISMLASGGKARKRSSGLSQVARGGRIRRDDCGRLDEKRYLSSRPTSDPSIARFRYFLQAARVLFQEARRFEPSALPPVAHARSPFACPTRSSRASRCTAPRPDEIRRARREICARVGARASDYGRLQAFVVKKATRFLLQINGALVWEKKGRLQVRSLQYRCTQKKRKIKIGAESRKKKIRAWSRGRLECHVSSLAFASVRVKSESREPSRHSTRRRARCDDS